MFLKVKDTKYNKNLLVNFDYVKNIEEREGNSLLIFDNNNNIVIDTNFNKLVELLTNENNVQSNMVNTMPQNVKIPSWKLDEFEMELENEEIEDIVNKDETIEPVIKRGRGRPKLLK